MRQRTIDLAQFKRKEIGSGSANRQSPSDARRSCSSNGQYSILDHPGELVGITVGTLLFTASPSIAELFADNPITLCTLLVACTAFVVKEVHRELDR